MALTFTEENYIKTIYMLLRKDAVVSTTALAAAIGTTPASVTDMSGKLRDKQLVEYEKYRGLTLTPQGLKAALLIIRRHRLWECFLVDQLKFSWEEVHEIAEELEHVRSVKLTERLSDLLGNPQVDPHGDPIPDASGRIPRTIQENLLNVLDYKKLEVATVTDQSASLLKFLDRNGIRPGAQLDILERHDFDHSVEIRVKKRSPLTISEQIAKHIYVRTNPKAGGRP
ncbi:MAG TPA: metal-dependent transcriptional regulator [Chitinophagaceae bacterium]|nr:metal-dependent transcriptional regulator [Chitinophagaceae bacterium]